MKKNGTKYKQIEEGRFFLKEQFQADRTIKSEKMDKNQRRHTK